MIYEYVKNLRRYDLGGISGDKLLGGCVRQMAKRYERMDEISYI